MQFLTLCYLRGSRQVAVTIVANEEMWAQLAPELQRMQDGIRIESP